MNDLISRQVAIDTLELDRRGLDYWIQHGHPETKEFEILLAQRRQITYDIDALNNVPDAEPENRKTAKLKCVYIAQQIGGSQLSGAAIKGIESRCWKDKNVLESILTDCGYRECRGYWEYQNYFEERATPAYKIVELKVE